MIGHRVTAPFMTRFSSLFRSVLFIFTVASFLSAQKWPTKEEKGEQAERQAWFYDQRSYPTGSIPPGARLEAIRRLRQIDAASRQQHSSGLINGVPAVDALGITMDSANWSLIGPQPTGGGTTYVTAGRVSAIAIDPTDNNTVYIGGAEGGVWKTTDGGNTWNPLTDNMPSLASGSIVIDPANHQTIYAGTGEDNFSGDSYYGAGILKSTDGGNTWTNILGPFLHDYVGAIAIQPGNSSVLLCASRIGIWRSTDGGATWLLRLPGTGTGVLFDPTNGSSAYATVGFSASGSNGVYHSTDGGVTWTLSNGTKTNGLPAGTAMGRIALAMAPSNSAVLYAQVEDLATATSGDLLGIWKTIDGGTTWNKLPISASQLTLWGNALWYYNTIAVSPVDPNVVWSGGIQPVRSTDGGITWAAPAQTGPNNVTIHVDFHALAFTPDGSTLYIGNDGGMYSTTDVTSARVNWTNLNNTLAITEFYPGMSLDPTNPQIAVGGTQDNGTQLFDGAENWTEVACGDGGFTAVDPSIPALAYNSCQYISINRSLVLTGNASWIPADYGIDQTDPVQFIAPLALDPSNPQTIYFGTYRLWQSQDSAGFWSPVSPDLTGGRKAGTLKAITIAPSDSNTVYIGTSNSKVQVTHDMQDAPTATWTDVSPGLPPRSVTRIAVDPIDPNTVYVSYSGFSGTIDTQGHVFRTTNGGANWTDISGNMPNVPVNDLVIDPDLAQTLYIGTDAGVMVTTNGGTTWSTLGNGLPLVVVDSLVLHRGARILRAGTHGRSVWDILVPLNGNSAAPVVKTLTPATANAGDPAFTLSVSGSNFLSSTVVRWNGQNRPTTFIDSGHLTVQIPAADLATIGRASVMAFNAAAGGGVSNSTMFLIGTGPQSTSKSAVSAANPLGGNNLGLRSIASVFGVNLAPGIAVASLAPPLPFTLGGTTLTMENGIQTIPLFFVSPMQVNFQVPFITTGPQQLTIMQGTQSVTIPVNLVSYAPALFSTNSQGSGQAATIIANTAIVAAPTGMFPGSRPAKIGEYVSIYCTGLGDVSNRPTLGNPSPGGPLAQTLTTPTVTIGGVKSTVIFSGLAPGYVGLYQVNALVPAGVAPGSAVSIVLSIGGVTSNTVTIAVDPAQE